MPYSDDKVQTWTIRDTVSGFTWPAAKGGDVYISKSLNNFDAAWTLVHEMTHIKQGPRKSTYDPKNLSPYKKERAQRELEAFTAETEWLLEKPERITGATLEKCKRFVTQRDGKWELNKAGIEAYVKRNYLDSFDKEAAGDYAATKYAYESNGDRVQVVNWDKVTK